MFRQIQMQKRLERTKPSLLQHLGPDSRFLFYGFRNLQQLFLLSFKPFFFIPGNKQLQCRNKTGKFLLSCLKSPSQPRIGACKHFTETDQLFISYDQPCALRTFYMFSAAEDRQISSQLLSIIP